MTPSPPFAQTTIISYCFFFLCTTLRNRVQVFPGQGAFSISLAIALHKVGPLPLGSSLGVEPSTSPQGGVVCADRLSTPPPFLAHTIVGFPPARAGFSPCSTGALRWVIFGRETDCGVLSENEGSFPHPSLLRPPSLKEV